MGLETLISRLDGARKTGHASFVARCPAHDDRSPSLSVREVEDGRLLVHCFGGCATEDVLAAIGLDFGDLFPPRPVDYAPRLRRAYPAADVLEALSTEALIVQMIGKNLLEGVPMVPEQYERLQTAVERIHDARRLANG